MGRRYKMKEPSKHRFYETKIIANVIAHFAFI